LQVQSVGRARSRATAKPHLLRRTVGVAAAVGMILAGAALAPPRASATTTWPVYCPTAAVSGKLGAGVHLTFQMPFAPGGHVRVTGSAANPGSDANFYIDAGSGGGPGYGHVGLPLSSTYGFTQSFDHTFNRGGYSDPLPVIDIWQQYGSLPVTFSMKFEPVDFASAATDNTCIGGALRLGGSNRAAPNVCGNNKADPVDSQTGNYWDTKVDLAVAGRGPALSLERSYNSWAAATDGPFGYGSVMNYGMRLKTNLDGGLTVVQENGSEAPFRPNGTGYAAPTYLQATLAHQGSGWLFVRNGRDRFSFDDQMRLTRIEALDGEATTLAYTGATLSSVTDSAGRPMQFTWVGGHVDTVTQTTAPARSVHYVYDGAGNLSDVTDVAGGNTHYTHDASHRRTTIRTPRHATEPTPKLITNYYDTLGRVVRQDDRAGGVWFFDYESVPGATMTTAPASRTAPAPPAGQLTAPANAGGVVTVEYFDGGVCSKRIIGYGDANAATWIYEHDPATMAVTKVIPAQHSGGERHQPGDDVSLRRRRQPRLDHRSARAQCQHRV
jgi:YD repeat-containing protein